MESAEANRSEKLGLWSCLHDGGLESMSSDLMVRTVDLVLQVFYINKFHNLPQETTFIFVCRGVQAVRGMRHRAWPGTEGIPADLPWDEQHARRLADYAKGRLESVSWAEVEALVSAQPGANVMNGYIEPAGARSVFTIEVWFSEKGKEDYLELSIDAEEFAVIQSDGTEMLVEQYLALGDAYWDAFAKRSEEGQQGSFHPKRTVLAMG